MTNDKRVSPTGTAWYPCLRQPDYYQGVNQGYKVSLELTPEEIQTFRRACAEAIEAAKYDPRFAGKVWDNPALPIRTLPNGKTVVSCKSQATIKTRDRGEVERKIPIYDSDGQIIDDVTVDIGTGSRIKVAYILSPYHKGRNACGIGARICAVQVVDLVPPGAGRAPKAETFGFGAVAGGSCHANNISNDHNGFCTIGNPVEDF